MWASYRRQRLRAELSPNELPLGVPPPDPARWEDARRRQPLMPPASSVVLYDETGANANDVRTSERDNALRDDLRDEELTAEGDIEEVVLMLQEDEACRRDVAYLPAVG